MENRNACFESKPLMGCQSTSSLLETPTRFVRVPAGGPTACVFELTVHAHERNAFVRHILNPFDGAHVNDYLADTLTLR